MDTRKDKESSENEEFPSYGEGKSFEGKPLLPDSEMHEIEYKAPEGFKYEFGYDEKINRYGYLLKPLESQEKPKAEQEIKDYFKNQFDLEEISRLFPAKQVTRIEVNFQSHPDDDANMGTNIRLEFKDGTEHQLNWFTKPEKSSKWKWGDNTDPSPLIVNSILNQPRQGPLLRVPILDLGSPQGVGPKK